MRTVIFAAIGFSLVSAMAGCATATPGFSKATRAMAEDFYKDYSMTSRMHKLRQYSLNDQYDIFIFGNQFRHPPATYLAECFALNGAAAVELLRVKLPTADRDVTVRDIVRLLKEIDYMRTYDVAGDAQLMAAATDRAAKMDTDWKELVEKWLAKIGQKRSEKIGFAPMCNQYSSERK